MTLKRLFLAGVLVTTLAGLFAAVGKRFSRHKVATPIAGNLPQAAEEYHRIMERYAGADSSIDLSGTIRIYDGENNMTLKEEKTFHYMRSGSQYYAQLSRLQTFCDGSLVLQLDTLNKSINVSAARHNASLSVSPVSLPLDRLFSDSASFRISSTVSRQGAEGSLRMQSDFSPEIKSCMLVYDTTTYRLHRAEMEWWKQASLPAGNQPNRIWLAKIDYHYQALRTFDMRKKISAVVSVTNGQVNPRPPYTDYQVNTRF